MLIGIIADLHANLEATLAVFDRLDGIGPDRIVCLGDLVGYNADPNEVIDIVRERQIPTVMGNHDAVVCGLEEPWFFNTKARIAVERHSECVRDDNKQWLATASEKLPFDGGCLGVHGSPRSRDDYILDWLDAMRHVESLRRTNATVCFFGHSHRASLFGERGEHPAEGTSGQYSLNFQDRYLINPGSVGQPRDHDPRAAFGLFDTESRLFEFCRVGYDIEAAARKIEEAGLPVELARRLAKGK
jgi:diadenosine tetraphosphatase ApaH/serine/threonine PP2A family protein phosphatase